LGALGEPAEGRRSGANGDTVAPVPGTPDIGAMEGYESMEVEALRRMSAAQKLAVMTSLIREAYRLKRAWIRLSEPGLSEVDLRRKVLEAMAGDRP
jgi:hypothetical protein